LILDRSRIVMEYSWILKDDGPLALRELDTSLMSPKSMGCSSIMTASHIVSFNGHSLFRVVHF
jgi:hypothetical protein